jgi:hypothetical protein
VDDERDYPKSTIMSEYVREVSESDSVSRVPMEDSDMKKISGIGVAKGNHMNSFKSLASGALIFGLLASTDAWAQNRGGNRGSLRNEIQRDRQELRNSRQEFRSDRRDLREDRRELRQDFRSGASPEEIARDRAEIGRSREELRDSRRELRADRRELNRDLREYDRRYGDHYDYGDYYRWRENYYGSYYRHGHYDDCGWWHSYSWWGSRCDRDW